MRGFAAVLAIVCITWPLGAVAQATCVNPGDIIDVPTPGFLRNETPNLVIDFERGGTVTPVTPISVTTSRIRLMMPSVGLVPDTQFKVRHVEEDGGTKVVATARTCNFPTGGGGGGGGGSTGGGGGGNGSTQGSSTGLFQERNARVVLTPATRFDVVAPSGAPEYILIGSAAEVSRAEGVVRQSGGSVLRRRGLNALGFGLSAVDLNGTLTLSALRGEFSRRGIDVGAGRHNVYGLASTELDFAGRLIGVADASACRLKRRVRIGMIDGPVNVRHPALAGATIEAVTVLGRRDRSATPDHGTGIAGLIVSPEVGLAPGATLFAVAAVSRAGAREVAKLEDVAAALDWLVSRRVDVVNMSLAGPSNAALARAISMASSKGVVLVAAVGNDRRTEVAYPASDPRVIAATAIDANKRLYPRASTGSDVDFAAPGVDVRVPTTRKMAFRSGTSYASAALTALIAVELANGGRRPLDQLRRDLATAAEDLGGKGRDPQYGFGLARFRGC